MGLCPARSGAGRNIIVERNGWWIDGSAGRDGAAWGLRVGPGRRDPTAPPAWATSRGGMLTIVRIASATVNMIFISITVTPLKRNVCACSRARLRFRDRSPETCSDAAHRAERDLLGLNDGCDLLIQPQRIVRRPGVSLFFFRSEYLDYPATDTRQPPTGGIELRVNPFLASRPFRFVVRWDHHSFYRGIC